MQVMICQPSMEGSNKFKLIQLLCKVLHWLDRNGYLKKIKFEINNLLSNGMMKTGALYKWLGSLDIC